MVDKLSKEELWAYSRQIVLSEIGYGGQVKLKQGRVLIAGVGGLGTPIALQLAAMGVGYLKIVDRDIIAESDLHRQYLYDVDSIGLAKVEVAASRLSALNPRITIEPIPISIKQWNVEELVKDVDVVVDGLDSVETRYLLNRACVKYGIPYIYGGSIQSQGNVSTIVPKKTACLECFNPLLKDEDLPKCGVVGVYPPILAITASIEVSETIRVLTGKEPQLAGKLFYIDLDNFAFEKVNLKRFDNCPVCSETRDKPLAPLKETFVEEQCSRDGRNSIIITPREWLQLDLEIALTTLKKWGYSLSNRGDLSLTCRNNNGSLISLLNTGVAVYQIPPTSTQKSSIRSEAITLYRDLLDKLDIAEKALPITQ